MTKEQILVKIYDEVATYYGLKPDKRFNNKVRKSRKRNIVDVRQMSHYLAREINKKKISYKDIGWYIGHKSHCTALYAYNLIKSRKEHDRELNENIIVLKNRCMQWEYGLRKYTLQKNGYTITFHKKLVNSCIK